MIGLCAALALLVVTRWLLPRRDHRLLRVPTFFLFVHIAGLGLALLVKGGTSLAAALSFVTLVSLLFVFGRLLGLLVLEVVLNRKLGRPVPTILRDIAQAVVYLFLLLGALRAIGFEPGSILTTGAVVTAVIGLSLQDTLGNLVAGLAIQMERPFEVGDWVSLDDSSKTLGRVVEINWRATRVLTPDDVEVIVPNGLLAKSPIVNYTKPTRSLRRNVYVTVAYEVPPARVHQIVLEAIAEVPGVLPDPKPRILTSAFQDKGIEYWLRYWTGEFELRDFVDSAVRDRVFYALRRAGFTIPVPQRTVHMHQISNESVARVNEDLAAERERHLRNVDILQVLDGPVLRKLAALAKSRLFAPGETIVRQGDDAAELCIVDRGAVAMLLAKKGEPAREVTRLGPGQFFGEMALVTGEKRQATVRAVTECELLVIDHAAFQAVLADAPDLVQEVSRVLAERQTMLDEQAETLSIDDLDRQVNLKSLQLIDRIKNFFQL